MKKHHFLVCAPLHMTHSSNGILALIHLAKTLQKFGSTVHMCQTWGKNDESILALTPEVTTPGTTPEDWQLVERIYQTTAKFGLRMCNDFSREAIDSSYVVYPECMLGNPLGARNVIRYFLNRDGILKNGAKVAVGSNDFLLTHSKVMEPNAHHVCHFQRSDPLFNRTNSLPPAQRTLDLNYTGKGALYGASGVVPNTVAITRTWPDTKEQLAILLRNCRFFYTADACSNINNEALSCGAIPVFMHNGPWTDAEIDAFDAGPMPRVHPGVPQPENFFETFEILRERYLEGLRQCELRWEPSVQEMMEKVDRHFASRIRGVPAPLPHNAENFLCA